MKVKAVDLGISVPEDNAAVSSPETMEMSSVAYASGKHLGKGARPHAPAARSRFFLTLSGYVPGRAGDQATDSSAASVGLDVSSGEAPGNKAPSESMALPAAAAAGPSPDKTPGQTPAEDHATPASSGPAPLGLESQGAAPSKRKDSSFFEKVFKLDKGREKAPVDIQHQEIAIEVAGLSRPPSDVPAQQDLVDSKEKEGQEVTTVPEAPEELEITKENPQTTDTTENNNSIMSFFKTLVSPNKAETKKDREDTASKTESICDGQAGQKTSEIQAKDAKKKHVDSPRLALAFRKFFRHKGAEKSPPSSADPKSDNANFIPQETPGAAKNPKGCSPSGQVPAAASAETAKEGGKEKAGPTSLPLGKLFWKKSIKEDSVPTGSEANVVCQSPVEIIKSEDVESTLQTVDLNEDGDAAPEAAEMKPKREESTPPRTSLMAFFRQRSVKGEGGNTHSEGIHGEDSSRQTSDSTEKATTSPEPEPEPATVGPKGKECSSKDKKPAAEMNKQKSSKQEAKEPAPCAEPCALEVNSLQSGDKSQKRPDKQRQSLRGFLKGLGPKQMLDAQVQTDPVSIGPVGKSK
ncbi:breast carcinoma-amplified sequence 1 [Orycteropus afer afer]|uniref:Breast carcinoma-amplified sequence 1 n=1 Tax=Orycteropus afer afer TaxID=1230840 RepID=A0AC54Z925_ORYAF|nr:breast carcinoma-amplified sequence 1 [Orycteropus afer afer]